MTAVENRVAGVVRVVLPAGAIVQLYFQAQESICDINPLIVLRPRTLRAIFPSFLKLQSRRGVNLFASNDTLALRELANRYVFLEFDSFIAA